ncbi:MAG: HlyD family efflux transporter periplasmic adaptor subunit [Marinifilaceae bacterium]|jgi:HlyD family secretion protein|nr:HlyD family efflux transporter periplasmic adaptor subunit [Marinifilaceae bacterium]
MKKILGIILICITIYSCGNNNNKFDASGTFESTEIIISSESMGKILNLSIEEGDKINKNEIVGIIDSVQLHLKKMQLIKNMQSVISRSPKVSTQLAILKEELKKQIKEQKRLKRLAKANAASEKQIDDISASVLILKSKIKALKSTLNNNVNSISAQSSAIEIQIAQIEDQLSKCYIKSPINGSILAKYSQEGEFARVGKPLFKIANLDEVFLKAYINSGQLLNLKLGQSVKVFANFGGDKQREYKAHISWISNKSEFTPKSIQTQDERENLVYAIKVKIKNDGYIKLGMYGEVKF